MRDEFQWRTSTCMRVAHTPGVFVEAQTQFYRQAAAVMVNGIYGETGSNAQSWLYGSQTPSGLCI